VTTAAAGQLGRRRRGDRTRPNVATELLDLDQVEQLGRADQLDDVDAR
jgi:hypothetical protein